MTLRELIIYVLKEGGNIDLPLTKYGWHERVGDWEEEIDESDIDIDGAGKVRISTK